MVRSCCVCGDRKGKLFKRGSIQKLIRDEQTKRISFSIMILRVCDRCYDLIKNYDVNVFDNTVGYSKYDHIIERISKIRRVKDPIMFYHLVCERIEWEEKRGIVPNPLRPEYIRTEEEIEI